MSWQATSWALEQRVGDTLAKLILLAIANYADPLGKCWPAQAAVAEDAEVSERTVRRKVQYLEEIGLLSTSTRGGDGTGRDTNIIQLSLPARQSGSHRKATGQTEGGYRTLRSGITNLQEPPIIPGLENEPLAEPSFALTPTEPVEAAPQNRAAPHDRAAAAEAKFHEFWAAYPKRDGGNPKAEAAKSFGKAVKAGADPDQIIRGAMRLAVVQRKDVGTKFIPQAVTWLNQKRWLDYEEATPALPGFAPTPIDPKEARRLEAIAMSAGNLG